MKKNNMQDFSIPRRQSQWAIIFIVLRFLYKLAKQLWPLGVAIFLGRSGTSSGFERYELIASGIGIFGMISSIIAYFKYYYHISDEELVIQKGILKKTKLNLPFARIQSINFSQSILHQALNVTAVEIESAGSDQKELKIDALTMENAEALRSYLLAKKQAAKVEYVSIDEGETITSNYVEEERDLILHLSPQELVRVGLTQNHLKPVGLIFGLLGSSIGYGYTMGMDPIDIIRSYFTNIEDIVYSQQIWWLLVLVPIMVLYSVVTTYLRHYNLQFTRSGKRFHVVQGLLNKQQFSALDRKIQILSWSQNPLQRILGLYQIFFRQAKSGDKEKEVARFSIPGCEQDKVEYVKENWLGEGRGQFDKHYGVSHHYFQRSAIYQSVVYGALLAIFIYLKLPIQMGLLVLWWIFSIYMSYKQYKKKSYALNEREIYIGGGILGFKHSLLPLYKVQNVAIKQNPYQLRRDLSTLYIYTSAGAIRIPYIPLSSAQRLLDLILYRVETSRKSWI